MEENMAETVYSAVQKVFGNIEGVAVVVCKVKDEQGQVVSERTFRLPANKEKHVEALVDMGVTQEQAEELAGYAFDMKFNRKVSE